MATGLLSMTTTLAPLTPGITRKSTYKHTGEACPSPKDPAPPVHPRFQVYVNFLWPSEGPRVQPREFCRSVHMCESSGTLLPVQMAGGMCVVVGLSEMGGIELKKSHLVKVRRLLAQSTQQRVTEECYIWRTQSASRGSRRRPT